MKLASTLVPDKLDLLKRGRRADPSRFAPKLGCMPESLLGTKRNRDH